MFIWLDYETYYDNDYSLKKMNRTMYLNDPRFKVHGCSFALDDSDPFWVTGADLPRFWADVEPYVTAMCCHNGLFDHGITAKFYMPRRVQSLQDTMSMAQVALMRKHPGLRVNLDALGQFCFPGDTSRHKINDVLGDFAGVLNLNAQQERRMAGYANQDNHVMRELHRWMLRHSDTPWDIVLQDISLTLAMGVYPVLEMNTELAAAVYKTELAAKEKAVERMKVERAALRSNNKFAALLLANGLAEHEMPTKLSKKGEVAYAFAAKDLDFIKLSDHPLPDIRALYELRIGEKSAQVMNRSFVFSQLPSPVPVPLVTAAGHTGRHGGDEFNLQNLKRGSDLRRCIRAAPGHMLLAADAKQIELRGNAWFCEEQTLIDEFNEGRDTYCEMGSVIYGRPITKADEMERFIGKTSELACQYQAGEERISGALQTAEPPKGHPRITKEQADELAPKIKRAYRSKRTKIVQMWKWLNDTAIRAMAGQIPPVERKGVRFELGRAILPSGRSLWYNDLRVNEKGEWVYKFVERNGGRCVVFDKKLYGGALLENLIQAMCYDIFMFQLRLADKYVSPPRMAVHDEGVFMIPTHEVPQAKADLGVIFQCAPDWFKGVPILGEFGVGETYADAK